MRLSADGARSLAALTAAAVGQQMEVLICGKNVLSPIVQEPIVWGSIVIIGPGAGLAVEQLDVLQGKAACPVGP